MMASPSRRRLEVASRGHARRMAPVRKAPMAQVRGKRKAGTKNMRKAGGHAHGRNEELARSDGGAALADAPEEDAAESEE